MGLWWALAPLEGTMGLVQSLNSGCSVCPLQTPKIPFLSLSQENRFPSFYPNPMPNPLSSQKQLLQLRNKAANTSLSDHCLLSFSTHILNKSCIFAGFSPKLMAMCWWQYCKPYISPSYPGFVSLWIFFKAWVTQNQETGRITGSYIRLIIINSA